MENSPGDLFLFLGVSLFKKAITGHKGLSANLKLYSVFSSASGLPRKELSLQASSFSNAQARVIERSTGKLERL